MADGSSRSRSAGVLSVHSLGALLAELIHRGYEVIGPVLKDSAIVYQPITKLKDLPAGYTTKQEPGSCRIGRRAGKELFGYVVGANSVKYFLHPPDIRLITAERDNGTFRILPQQPENRKFAFFGIRPCDVAAMQVQDRVLTGDRFTDPIYRSRRQDAFVLAVHCTRPASTCFCTSMGTGPRAKDGFDIALTELADKNGHRFLAEAGSDTGSQILSTVESEPAPEELVLEAERAIESAARQIKRHLPAAEVRDLLYDNFDSPHWDDVAARCLSCGNCTMVCPTCFCVTFEDTSDITGQHAERWRRWDSCFTQDFSYIHGGSVRLSSKSRYRQWLTHKLAAWQDQFGCSGCVGCGRCITWCPVGIDLTREVASLRQAATPVNSQR